MTHPIADCLPARDLMKDVFNSTQVIAVDPLLPGWYMVAKEQSALLQAEPEYRAAMDAYQAHVRECETCRGVINELNVIE
jgi:hypothetical protein